MRPMHRLRHTHLASRRRTRRRRPTRRRADPPPRRRADASATSPTIALSTVARVTGAAHRRCHLCECHNAIHGTALPPPFAAHAAHHAALPQRNTCIAMLAIAPCQRHKGPIRHTSKRNRLWWRCHRCTAANARRWGDSFASQQHPLHVAKPTFKSPCSHEVPIASQWQEGHTSGSQ